MSVELVYRESAWAEFDTAYDWYEEQRRGLGSDFVSEVQRTFERIAANPRLFLERRLSNGKRFRRAQVDRFPYRVYFIVRGDRAEIFSVHHDKRDPKLWQDRL